MTRVRIAFDLDGTLCTETNGEYALARPLTRRIARLRELRDAGAYIIINSARGSHTGYDWLDATTEQLHGWGVPYDELHVGRKPFAHVYADDRAVSDGEFFGDAIESRWPDSYYDQRHGNDPRRQKAFAAEANFLSRHRVGTGSVCDVGCSTGEFLDSVVWLGPRHGMEVSHVARRAARKRGIDFTRNIYTERDYFDCVIFRGTLQHLPSPFEALQRAHRALKPGGHLAILATPNTDSWCYRLLGQFPPPLNDGPRNFWMPSSRQLQNALQNYGFGIVAVEYPYWGGPYARPAHDVLSFALAAFGKWRSFSWPQNMLNLIARKT